MASTTAWAQYAGHISSFVADANTGQVLSAQDADLERYPASLTKLMTLYLAFRALDEDKISLDQLVPISIHAASMEPSKLGLRPGNYITVEQAILALVTKSANDAACALGELLGGGSEEAFGQIMTQQARALGMDHTTFKNASGLPDPEQVTTARDLATLTRHIIQDFPDNYHYFGVPYFVFHGRVINNHDPMLKIYPGADGLKTGYTASAGHNLVTSAQRGDVRLIGVVLGAHNNPQRSSIMANILDDGFAREGAPVVTHPLVLARASSSYPAHTVRHRRKTVRHLASPNASEVAEASLSTRHRKARKVRILHSSSVNAKVRLIPLNTRTVKKSAHRNKG
ncbi:D-alanyl-D-alanine carboxypeptidase [Entomobacter blattae]|uniref:D-alanyl-D-alanine carboxypeptidase n=2 Tax=Entomobacter blattae TaxID=2762277 RepID=A0A7H1NTJ5_9PROT|nr:D-alanyl-D-alanine carboxypeptidase [Entomobacter blattae]